MVLVGRFLCQFSPYQRTTRPDSLARDRAQPGCSRPQRDNPLIPCSASRAPCLSSDVTVLLLTLVAAAAALCTVVSVDISGLLAANFTAAEVIRRRFPFHLRRPEWVAGKDQPNILGR